MTTTRTIAALDTPTAVVEAGVREQTLLRAAHRTHSPSDEIGDSHAAWLTTHPDAAYTGPAPAGWDQRIAAIEALNEEGRRRAARRQNRTGGAA